MTRSMPIAALVFSALLPVLSASAADQASSAGDGNNQVTSQSRISAKKTHRHVASASRQNAPVGFAGPAAEFAAAAAYENSGQPAKAVPLYQELVRGGSQDPVGKDVKLDNGDGPRLGATVADEAAHRLEVIASKERPIREGALPFTATTDN